MYIANVQRYDNMPYHRVGNSGLKLPAISLGLWHNFGYNDLFANSQALVRFAFDSGITHFDLANNYGPPPGSAEENFGRILAKDFKRYRDEMIISSKAGYDMWPGPYGDMGSKKYIIASANQSLRRLGLEYVDIFYTHRPDPETCCEETAQALDLLVRQGKALYIGVSNYSAEQTEVMAKIFSELKTPFIIHQPSYSLFNRWVEDGLKDVLVKHQLGAIAFSPLAQGLLSDRYLNGIPDDSRAHRNPTRMLSEEHVNQSLARIRALHNIADKRGQSLSQMAIAWILRDGIVTSVLVGASKVSQLEDSLGALKSASFSTEELQEIDRILAE